MRLLLILLAFLLALPILVRAGDDEECEERWGRREEDCYITVPEIDGGTLPKALLLLVSLYVVASASTHRNGRN